MVIKDPNPTEIKVYDTAGKGLCQQEKQRLQIILLTFTYISSRKDTIQDSGKVGPRGLTLPWKAK
jgi:hypothetical protein